MPPTSWSAVSIGLATAPPDVLGKFLCQSFLVRVLGLVCISLYGGSVRQGADASPRATRQKAVARREIASGIHVGRLRRRYGAGLASRAR